MIVVNLSIENNNMRPGTQSVLMDPGLFLMKFALLAKQNLPGTHGEVLAAEWLLYNGYVLPHRNRRSARYEIDIMPVRKTPCIFWINISVNTIGVSKYKNGKETDYW